MPHRERQGSHPWSRSHRPRMRGGQRDIKNEVWRYAPASASLLGTRTGAVKLSRSNDIHALEKFVTVVKLQAERRDGELEDGTLHSLLVKKLPDR